MNRELLLKIRNKRPIIHCITNYVSINDCANILLACGASPVMADDPEEAGEITAACNALVLNMGMLNPRRLEAMMISGAEANRRGIPVVFDPVGAGSSTFRKAGAQKIIANISLAVIRGNAGEINALITGSETRGVDCDYGGIPEMCASLAKHTGAAVICSGERDIVTDGDRCVAVSGGHSMMRSVTGAGCQLSALAGAFASVCEGRWLTAAAAAACTMKHCGAAAYKRLCPADGNASYRNYIIDAVYNLRPEDMEDVGYEIIR